MISTGPADLKALGDPLASALLPGWRITWAWCDSSDIGDALAMIFPDPLRSMAVIKVAPHPPGEDVRESIAHELVHGAISPLVQGRNSASDVALEEPIVERIGVLLASLWAAVPGLARRIPSVRVWQKHERGAARARSRITARSRERARGNMDPNMVKEALDAIVSGDAEKCAEILKGLIASAASGGAEPDGDEMAKLPPAASPGMGDAPPPKDAAYPQGDARAMARLMSDAKAHAVDMAAMHADLVVDGKTSIVNGLRARLPGHSGLPAIERKILAAKSYGEAKAIAEIAEAMGGGTPRARSGVEHQSATPATDVSSHEPEAKLRIAGHSEQAIAEYVNEHNQRGSEASAAMLRGMESGLARARRAAGKAVVQ